ncbi:MAG TPA: cytochrome c [Nitrococcus sp.]|nr:cytochrome c [Nitrococcus sp.]
MRAKLFIFLGFMVAAATAAQAAGDPIKGRQLAETCLGCHGVPGYRYPTSPTFQVPKVGGQHAAYIVSALQEYKKGNRDNPTMRAQATKLTDQDMQDIAAFFEQAGQSGR